MLRSAQKILALATLILAGPLSAANAQSGRTQGGHASHADTP